MPQGSLLTSAGASRIRTLGPTTQSTPRGCEGPYYPECIKLSHRVRPVHLDFSQNPAAHLVPIGFAYDRLGQAGHPGRDAAASLSGAAGRT